jgi:hypothetical protein
MTKKLLLAASALAVIGFAGAAAATDITSAKVSGIPLTTTGASKTSYTVANEVITGTAANLKTTTVAGDNTVASTLPAGSYFEPGVNGTNYTATLTLTGGTFQTAIAANTIVVNGAGAGCIVSAPTIVSGGGAGQSTLTAVFNVGTACTVGAGATAPTGVTFDVPFAMDAGASTVSASVNYTVATTGGAFGGSAGTATLVQKAAGYSVAVSDAPQTDAALPTSFALGTGTPYVQLVTGTSNDNVIGSVKAGLATAPATSTGVVYANLGAVGLPALTYDLSVAGNFAVLAPGIDLTDADAKAATSSSGLTVNAAKTSATATALSGARTFYVTVPAGNTVSTTAPQSSTVTVTPKVPAATTTVAAPAAVSNRALETIGLQGTNFFAPWVQSSNTNGYNTVLRVSNSGAATGPVTLALTSPIGTATATTCSATQLPKLANVPANGELAINSADLTTCFGAFTRGDVRVTIQAQSNNLSAKLRIVNPGNVVTEQSLGAIAAGVASVN